MQFPHRKLHKNCNLCTFYTERWFSLKELTLARWPAMPCPLYCVGTPVWYMFIVLCSSFSYCKTALPKVVSRKKNYINITLYYKRGMLKMQHSKRDVSSAPCDYNFAPIFSVSLSNYNKWKFGRVRNAVKAWNAGGNFHSVYLFSSPKLSTVIYFLENTDQK